MNAHAESVLFFLLASCVFLLAGSVVSALLARSIRVRAAGWAPRMRHRMLVSFAGLPAFVAAALLVSACLPSLIALFIPAFDHCNTHDDAHAHLCFVHLSRLQTPLPIVMLLVSAVGYALVRSLFVCIRLQRSYHVLQALRATGTHDATADVTIVETAKPLCLAAGLLKGRVLVSRGLLRMLDARSWTVVLSHERAHIERKDALVAVLVRALCSLHLPSVGSWIQRELAIAAEQVCDERAASTVGDRLAVAETILTVERALQRTGAPELGPAALAFGASAVERRVEALLNERLPECSLLPVGLGAAAALGVVLAVCDGVHHVTESVLSALTQ